MMDVGGGASPSPSSLPLSLSLSLPLPRTIFKAANILVYLVFAPFLLLHHTDTDTGGEGQTQTQGSHYSHHTLGILLFMSLLHLLVLCATVYSGMTVYKHVGTASLLGQRILARLVPMLVVCMFALVLGIVFYTAIELFW